MISRAIGADPPKVDTERQERGKVPYCGSVTRHALSTINERTTRGTSVRCVAEPSGQGVLDVESYCQADFASRMIVTAARESGTVIVTVRPVCRASRRAGPVRTVK